MANPQRPNPEPSAAAAAALALLLCAFFIPLAFAGVAERDVPSMGDADSDASEVVEAEDVDEAHPAPGYFARHAEGWFWYHDPRAVKKPKKPKPEIVEAQPAPPPVAAEPDDPVKAIEAERHEVDVAMDRAILNPSPENMKTYLVLNQKVMEQANNFSTAWKGTIWSNPSLDNTLNSPTGSSAYIKADVDSENQELQLAQAAQTWGVVFFFRGTCPYCHKFAPILKQFAEKYGFNIVDVSLDGGGLPEFPNPHTNGQAAEALKVEAVPAVYLVNPSTRQVVPATFGLVGWSELAERITYAIDHASQGSQDAGNGRGSDAPNLSAWVGTR